jgi:hypothetical protein
MKVRGRAAKRSEMVELGLPVRFLSRLDIRIRELLLLSAAIPLWEFPAAGHKVSGDYNMLPVDGRI